MTDFLKIAKSIVVHFVHNALTASIIRLESEYQNSANNVSIIRNINTQLLMNVCRFNVRLYSCKSPLLTIGSNGVLNFCDVPI